MKSGSSFSVPNDRLSSYSNLFIEIVLAQIPAEGSLLHPPRVGDRVWYERRRIRLEGTEPRFPIEVVQLDGMLRGKTAGDALWYLDWSSDDWHRDFHAQFGSSSTTNIQISLSLWNNRIGERSRASWRT